MSFKNLILILIVICSKTDKMFSQNIQDEFKEIIITGTDQKVEPMTGIVF